MTRRLITPIAAIAAAIAIAIAWTLPAAGQCLTPPSGDAPLQSGRVADIPDGHSLILSDGRHLRLDGLTPLTTPQGQSLADARVALQRIAAGGDVFFFATAKTDRYDRLPVIAHRADESSLQQKLLAAGWARVADIPHLPCRESWFAAEEAARIAGAGLWSLPRFAVRRASDPLVIPAGSFQIVEGRVTDSQIRHNRLYLDFGSNWRTDFTATVAPKHRKKFADSYTGCHLRLRGWITDYNGPRMELKNPANMEQLTCPP